MSFIKKIRGYDTSSYRKRFASNSVYSFVIHGLVLLLAFPGLLMFLAEGDNFSAQSPIPWMALLAILCLYVALGFFALRPLPRRNLLSVSLPSLVLAITCAIALISSLVIEAVWLSPEHYDNPIIMVLATLIVVIAYLGVIIPYFGIVLNWPAVALVNELIVAQTSIYTITPEVALVGTIAALIPSLLMWVGLRLKNLHYRTSGESPYVECIDDGRKTERAKRTREQRRELIRSKRRSNTGYPITTEPQLKTQEAATYTSHEGYNRPIRPEGQKTKIGLVLLVGLTAGLAILAISVFNALTPSPIWGPRILGDSPVQIETFESRTVNLSPSTAEDAQEQLQATSDIEYRGFRNLAIGRLGEFIFERTAYTNYFNFLHARISVFSSPEYASEVHYVDRISTSFVLQSDYKHFIISDDIEVTLWPKLWDRCFEDRFQFTDPKKLYTQIRIGNAVFAFHEYIHGDNLYRLGSLTNQAILEILEAIDYEGTFYE